MHWPTKVGTVVKNVRRSAVVTKKLSKKLPIRLRKMPGDVLARTASFSGDNKIEVTLRGLGRSGFLLTTLLRPPPRQDKFAHNLTHNPATPMSWVTRITRGEGDVLAHRIAEALGYEVEGHSLRDATAPWVGATTGRAVSIRFPTKFGFVAVAVSRVAAQKLLDALAIELDWELTRAN